MTLQQLKYVTTVAQTGTISDAAKKLFISQPSLTKAVRELEKEILELINKTGIGPMGLGGKNTALAVKVNSYPCHIASLPLAVNINCHAARHKEVVL